MALEKSDKRNPFGVKNCADMYRTFNGEHYGQWMSFPSVARVKAYRAAGVRCRRIGEELYVHHMDEDDASKVDAEMGDR